MRLRSLSLLLVASLLFHCTHDEQSLGANRPDLAGAGASGADAGGASGTGLGGASGMGLGGSAGTTSTTSRRLCDGSDGLTLGYRVDAGGMVDTGSYVQYELGATGVFVDGHCQYWIINPSTPTYQERSRWRAVHTGTLSAAQEQQLSADVGYDQWPQLYGDRSGSGIPDASSVVVFDRAGSFSCGALCKPATQAVSQTIAVHIDAWVDELYTQGAPVATPMRVRAAQLSTSKDGYAKSAVFLPWALATSLSSVALGSGDEFHGDAPQITDPGDLTELRKLRDQMLTYNNPFSTGLLNVYLEQETPFARALVFFRDTIPLENEHGLIPVP